MALPPIATATPPITVTKSDGTTISVPSPVTTPLTNNLRMLGAGEVVQANILDTNFLQLLEHFASTTAPTTPVVGQLWYDLNAPEQFKIYTGLAAPNDWEPLSCCGGNLVDPANTTVVAGPTGSTGGGSGTSGSPYIINDTVVAGTTKLVATITVTGLLANQFVPIVDLNQIINGNRFSFSNYFADLNGDLTFNVYLNDMPASASGTNYTCALKVGSASVYVDINVAIQSAFPVSPINYPTDTGSVPTSWTAVADTLTPSGCIQISKDNSTWISNPATLSISTGDTLYTRWRGTPGSGTCIDSADGVTITGGITSSNGSTTSSTITIDKTPATITFTAATNQTLSSVTQSNTITVSGINSYGYITGTITNGTNLEASVNGGTWTAVPVSGTTLYVINGQSLQLRLTNSAIISTTSTATISVGTTSGITWTSTTVAVGPTVSTPSILTPVANATNISTTPTITSSAYSASGGAGTHASSDWQIATDAAFTNIVASSFNDAANLTSWTVPSALNGTTNYYVRVRYNSSAPTVTSAYSTGIKFTTAVVLATPFIVKVNLVNTSYTLSISNDQVPVIIDWGDGNTTTINTINAWPSGDNYSHTYATTGVKTIKVTGNKWGTYYTSVINSYGFTYDVNRITDILQWGTNKWTTLEYIGYLWQGSSYSATDSPDLSSGTYCRRAFISATDFNGNIASWNTSNVTDMNQMFYGATAFNQPIGVWNVSNVTSIGYMFSSTNAFNQPLNSWNVSKVTDMMGTFYYAKTFNQPLNSWNTANVTRMDYMFSNANVFNQTLNSWDTSNVSNIAYMFANAKLFNSAIDTWNTGNVTNMSQMFYGATAFNNGYASGVAQADMNRTVASGWKTNSITSRFNMSQMFEGATSWNGNISNWCVTNATSLPPNFDTGATSWTLPGSRPTWGSCPIP